MTGVGRNCFPVRSLTKNVSTKVNTKDEGGAWLVAYKAEQRRRFKAVLCCDQEIPTSQKPVKRRLQPTPEDENTRKQLDGFYLMNNLHVNDPLDLCSINICDKGLTQVNEDDFSLFENVMHIDAGENNLDLIHFINFPNLRELELPLNNIGGDIILNDGYYKGLEKLDLSCNHLTSNDIIELGILPELKQLHLTGNHLKQLPCEMSRSYFTDQGHRKARFPKLEKLWLDQNDLMESNTFSCLAGLKRLKYLNLEQNKIACVPSLRLLDASNGMNTDYSSPIDGYNDDYINDQDLQKQSTTKIIDKMVDEQLDNVNKQISDLEDALCSDNNDQYNSMNDRGNDKTFTYYYDSYIQTSQPLPFLSLEHLNLANNYLENEEDLLALSTWPALKELVIWGNPVATRGKEGPAIINYRLGLIAGINVARRKPSPKPKYQLALSQLKKNPRKVDELPPLIHSKKLLMLEEPKYSKSCDVKPLPPITAPCQNTDQDLFEPLPKRSSSAPVGQHHHKNANKLQEHSSPESHVTTTTTATTTAERQDNDEETSEERVFLTQVDDNDEPLVNNAYVQQTTTTTTTTTTRTKTKPPNMKIPDKYKGYEELLNIDETCIDDIKLPKGIHSNAMALQYILKHPLIFTDNATIPRNRRKQADKTPIKSQDSPTTVEELGAVLEKMRTHSNIVESNLGDLLNSNTDHRSKKEIKQARKLLKQVQTKYDEVRSESLRSTTLTSELPSQLNNIILKPNK